MAKILIVEDNQGTNKAICEYMNYQFLTNVAYYHPNSYNTYLSHFIVQI